MSRTGPDGAVARQAFKRVWVGATVCAVVFGSTAASSALSYISSFPTELSRHQIALTTGRDAGLAVLLGPVSAIGTVGGYTFYKGFVFLTTIGALWAMFASTRLLRGEEDAGRWQLLMAGATRPARATAATLVALGAGVGVIFVGATAFAVLAGHDPKVAFGLSDSVIFGLSMALPVAVFVGVGAVTSQLGRTRRAANGVAFVVFGVTFVLRMIADSASASRWLLWTTPFGWSERMHPFTANDLWPLVPAALATIALCSVAIMLASRRDSGDGLLASRDVARLRPFGLGSAFGLSARRELPVLIAWCTGSFAAGVLFGVIAKLTTSAVPKSLNDTLEKFGVHGSFANQYFGVAFLLVGAVVALLPAGQVGAAGEEETSGRVVQVLTRSTRRTNWFAGRLTLCAVAVVSAGLLAGLGAWLGASSQGVHVAFTTMLGAGFNVVPTALVALGVGALALAAAPRIAAAIVYGIIVWSLVIDLSASLVSTLRWLEHVSLFHYMALAPAQHSDPATLAITFAIALVLCIAATVLFDRRDLETA